MVDRGKAPMDPRQEEAEERAYKEQQRLREERIRIWWRDWEQSPLSQPPMAHKYWHYDVMMTGVPHGPNPSYPQGNVPTSSTPTAPELVSSSHPLTVRTVSTEGTAEVQPSERQRRFLQDIRCANLDMYWSQFNEPVPPKTGPCFQFSQGFCNFQFGAISKEIAEKEYWLARELMARGENQDPPTPDGESIIVSFEYSEEGNNPNEVEAEEEAKAEAEVEVEVEMEVEAEEEGEAEMEVEAEVEVEIEMGASNNEGAGEEEDEEVDEGDENIEEEDESELQSTITDAYSQM